MGIEGILLVNKPQGKTSFSLVYLLRKILGVKKIGHAGTLDPFATGVMVMLIGRNYTRLSDRFLTSDKEYRAKIHLGIVTDSYDCTGEVLEQSKYVPSLSDVKRIIAHFQGEVEQVPPMFSAKKINGKKLYELARKGETIDRQAVKVKVSIDLLDYSYPLIDMKVECSKGTYIRSLAHDIGAALGCGGHLMTLERTRSGEFSLEDCLDGDVLSDVSTSLEVIAERIKKDF